MGLKKFIRIRGRVQGPFDEERLRSLASRGQFGRIHEVSDDGHTWEKASAYPELFVQPQNDTLPSAADTSVNRDRQENATTTRKEPASAEIETWYYAEDGKRRGPVDLATLQLFISTRQLSSDDLVWKDGMEKWTPASQVPGIIKEKQSSNADTTTDLRTATADSFAGAEVSRVLRGSRPWVLFIAVMGFIGAALALVGGLILVIAGSRVGTSIAIAQGLFSMLFAVLLCIGSLLLTSYGNHIGRYLFQPDAGRLKSTLESLRLFWVYVGINLIVALVLLACFGISVLSVGGTF